MLFSILQSISADAWKIEGRDERERGKEESEREKERVTGGKACGNKTC